MVEWPDARDPVLDCAQGHRSQEDDQGNIYYHSKDDKRRWVIYNGEAEASRVSPDWHGWLHRTWNDTPVAKPLVHKACGAPHQEKPDRHACCLCACGSLNRAAPVKRSDYDAWQPE